MSAAFQRETAAFAFGDEEFSDVELVFVQEPLIVAEQDENTPEEQQSNNTSSEAEVEGLQEGSTTSAAQDQEQKQQEEQQPKDEVLHRLPGHALTLAVHSEYFKTALSQRWRKEGGGKLEIQLSGPEELEAALKVIEVMYSHQLDLENPAPKSMDSSLSPAQLIIKMIVWADRWQASGCVDVCLSKLAEVLEAPDVDAALRTIPEAVQRAAGFSSIQPTCEKWLVEQFGDVFAIITGAELLQSFCALSFSVLLWWAVLDGLVVHTENDVAVLLALWHDGEVGKQCSEEEVAQLGQLLRVGHLTTIFRRVMLPQLAWFHGHVAEMNTFAVLWDHYGVNSPELSARIGIEFPAAWSASARNGVLPPDASNRGTIVMQVPEAELSQMLQKDTAGEYNEFVYSASYWYGYFWLTKITLKDGLFGGFVYCAPHGPVPAAACVKYTSAMNGESCGPTFIGNRGAGWGKANIFLDIADPITSLEQLQPRISDGCLEARFELKDIN